MFCFLIDPKGWIEIDGEAFAPGFFVWNSEVGRRAFLTATIEHFKKQLTKKSSAVDKKAIEECIWGIEKKQLPHLLCVTNMLLHGIDVPSQIEHRNTLAKGWNDWSFNERVDCVITNPPFGGMEDDGVGNDYPSDVRTRETADMFLTLIVKKLLKDKGRGAVVLPDGTLFGEGVKGKVKELLLRECNLHTIVRLPNGVFNPYTGIKTNLLFFTKGKPTETIWFYEHRYPQGVKSYSKTKPLRLEELQPIAEWWGKESMSVSGLLKSEYFGLRSTVDGETRRRLDRRNFLYAKGDERTQWENEEMSRLSHELSELGFANDFKDPMYDLFVKRMAKMTQFHKDALTPEEQAAQDAAADEIIQAILAEEKPSRTQTVLRSVRCPENIPNALTDRLQPLSRPVPPIG
jgi:type I restriction-modification system DNA methylase subunit